MSRSFNLKGKMVREPPCSMFWNSFSVNMFTESWNAASTSWLRWKVVCQRHCLHKKVSKSYSLPTKIFSHIGSTWTRVVVPWVLRAINHILPMYHLCSNLTFHSNSSLFASYNLTNCLSEFETTIAISNTNPLGWVLHITTCTNLHGDSNLS